MATCNLRTKMKRDLVLFLIIGMFLLSEALNHLCLEQFLLSNNSNMFDIFFKEISEFQEMFVDERSQKIVIIQKWEKCIKLIPEFKESFAEFKRIQSQKNKNFQYWTVFLDEIFPIIRYLTNSFRERNWTLHLCAVRKAIPLFFAFDRVNYSRWMPLYFDDCLKLRETFPLIHEQFLNGDFTVQHSRRPCSAIPIDQALEKAYNKTAKGKGGIIGITAQKAAVAKWNLIKHEKMQYVSFLSDLCDFNVENEYTLHHEFSDAVTSLDVEHVDTIVSYIRERGNPFNTTSSGVEITNLVTGAVLDANLSNYLVQCIKLGEDAYKEYTEQRFKDKSKELHDVIPKNFKRKKESQTVKKIDIQKETLKALKYIDYARVRNYSIQDLLKYELASTSFYLTKENLLRKTQKSELMRSLEQTSETTCPAEVPVDTKETAIFIDFMAYSRKIAVHKPKVDSP